MLWGVTESAKVKSVYAEEKKKYLTKRADLDPANGAVLSTALRPQLTSAAAEHSVNLWEQLKPPQNRRAVNIVSERKGRTPGSPQVLASFIKTGESNGLQH